MFCVGFCLAHKSVEVCEFEYVCLDNKYWQQCVLNTENHSDVL